MSVKTSDQACARYIIVVLKQAPGAGDKSQVSYMGKHCSRLAAKKATVHEIVRAIIIHEMIENVLVKKILVKISLAKFPSVKGKKHRTFDRG